MKRAFWLLLGLIALAGCANVLGLDPLPGPAPDDAGTDASAPDASDQ